MIVNNSSLVFSTLECLSESSRNAISDGVITFKFDVSCHQDLQRVYGQDFVFLRLGVHCRHELSEQSIEADNGPNVGDLSASCLFCTTILPPHYISTFLVSCSIASLKLQHIVCECVRVCEYLTGLEKNGDVYYQKIVFHQKEVILKGWIQTGKPGWW